MTPPVTPTLDSRLAKLTEALAGVANELLNALPEAEKQEIEAALRARHAEVRFAIEIAPAVEIVAFVQAESGAVRKLGSWGWSLPEIPARPRQNWN